MSNRYKTYTDAEIISMDVKEVQNIICDAYEAVRFFEDSKVFEGTKFDNASEKQRRERAEKDYLYYKELITQMKKCREDILTRKYSFMPIDFAINENEKILRGNTFKIKDEIKNKGGKWEAKHKVWIVPSDVYEELKAAM